MSSVVNLIRSDLKDFMSYSSARYEENKGRIWLNANELPWEIVKHELGPLNRYPEKQPASLINKLAEYYQVTPNQLLATRGSDEGIDLLIRLFCQASRDTVLICPPTFGMYEVSAKLQGAGVIKIPLHSENFELDINQVLAQWHSNIKLIFLCSPNNPTGNLINVENILQLCQKLVGKSIIVLDEAYLEFSGSIGLSSAVEKFPNLVILRTLSKAFGLAALRLGAVIANEEVIYWLNKILPPYPLSILCINSAIKALEKNNLDELQKKVKVIVDERERMFEILRKLKIVEKIWESKANFILVKFNRPIEKDCQNSGIILRNMSTRTGIANSMRITVGTPAENSELISMLEKL